ncbi:MAG: DsrE family protein [Trueperaceae bacterium]|nr:DsrE family protein [Trueperaceae bacterium]
MRLLVQVLADVETHGDLGRVVNAMEVVKEAKQAGDDVVLSFDGAGTRWVGTLDDPEHPRHALWADVKDRVAGACSYCATAFGASEAIEGAGVALVDAFEGHPSVRGYLADGYRVLTY